MANYSHSWNRRQFLSTSTAGIALAATVPSVACAAKADEFASFRIGLQSYCYRKFSLHDAVNAMSDIGLHYVELYPGHAPVEASDAEANKVVELCKDHGVNPMCIGVMRFTDNHDDNRKNFEHAKRLGC